MSLADDVARMRARRTTVRAGQYYGEPHDGGPLVPLAVPPRPPDVVVCRRVADFPGGQVPPGAAVVGCAQCAAPIVYNAARQYAAPRVCMQCMQIAPDPL